MEYFTAFIPKGENPSPHLIKRTIVEWNENNAEYVNCWNGKIIGNIYENPELKPTETGS